MKILTKSFIIFKAKIKLTLLNFMLFNLLFILNIFYL